MIYGRCVCLLGFFLLSAACTDTAERRTAEIPTESEAVQTWLNGIDNATNSPSPVTRQAPPVADMIDGLIARLEQHPDDRKGWELLARSYEFMGNDEQARVAAERATALRIGGDSAAVADSSASSN